MKPKLLLHVCCGPCSTHVINTLKEDYDVTAFFYNPNIYPKLEYEKRVRTAKKFCEEIDVPFIEADYDPEYWFELVKGHEEDPEGGDRCSICFRMRMAKTAEFAKNNGFDFFTNTMTVSPHKNAEIINQIGAELAENNDVDYLESNFKKQDGFKKSIELSKEHDLYRQHYCGCLYSMKASQ